jgi:hypothetical protein
MLATFSRRDHHIGIREPSCRADVTHALARRRKSARGGPQSRESVMQSWMWSWWLWQWFGFVLIGAGLVVARSCCSTASQHGRVPTSPLVMGDTTVKAQINFASIRIGGDLGGLLVVIGVILALIPVLWGFYVVAAVGAVVVAVVLFAWHRYHPR